MSGQFSPDSYLRLKSESKLEKFDGKLVGALVNPEPERPPNCLR
jgi:hypothetical protein